MRGYSRIRFYVLAFTRHSSLNSIVRKVHARFSVGSYRVGTGKASLDLQNLLSDIRAELGTYSSSSATRSMPSAHPKGGMLKRYLMRAWRWFPPSLQTRIRGLPFFFTLYLVLGKISESRKPVK